MAGNGYRAFLSYSHRDKAWGQWLHRALEKYRVPRKLVGTETQFGEVPPRLTPIFRDRDDLPAAADLSSEIDTALEQSQFLIIVCSPSAATSRWVNAEILRFKQLHGEHRILAALIDGEPFASVDPAREHQECLPEALRYRMGPAGLLTDQRAEPIAADFRPGGDGRRYGLSKIAAGMLGIGLDELIRREAQRRTSRLSAVAAASLVFAGSMGLLTYLTVVARNEAQMQRAEAEKARGDAEGLIEFMLTDLRAKLDAVGRLDVLDAVGERALQYYLQQNVRKTDADALVRRARTQLLIGEVDNLRGDLDAALAAYQEAMRTTEEQFRRDPNNAHRVFDHAQSVFYVAYIAWQRGDLDTAEKYVTQYGDLARRLVEMDPANPDWQMELGYAAANLGAVLFDQRKWQSALAEFHRSKQISMAKVAADPDDVQAKLDLGQDYSFAGETLTILGRYEDAEQSFRQEIALYDEILGLDPLHQLAKIRKHQAELFLARISISQGEVEQAADHLTALREVVEAQAADDDDTRLPEILCTIDLHLSTVFAALGNREAARKTSARAVELAGDLAGRDRSLALWQANYAKALSGHLRMIGSASGTGIESQLKNQFGILLEILRKTPSDPFLVSAAAETKLLLGELAARTGDQKQAQAHWTEGLSLLPEEPERRMPSEQRLAFLLQASLGNADEAEEIAKALEAVGYRHPDLLNF